MNLKTTYFLFLIGIAFVTFAHSVGDARLSFSTKGPDRYADGSVVLDGECYALVWSKDGKFEGFAANGECIDECDRIVLIAPIAKEGHCPPVLFRSQRPRRTNWQVGSMPYICLTRELRPVNQCVRAAL